MNIGGTALPTQDCTECLIALNKEKEPYPEIKEIKEILKPQRNSGNNR
jgi:hypothetical protein